MNEKNTLPGVAALLPACKLPGGIPLARDISNRRVALERKGE